MCAGPGQQQSVVVTHFGLPQDRLLYRVVHACRPWSFTASYFPMLLTALTLTSVPRTSAALWEGAELGFLLRFVALLVAGL
eukprot:SAG31_NODE_16561_length_704_cov_0.935537_1_plen_80_part_01